MLLTILATFIREHAHVKTPIEPAHGLYIRGARFMVPFERQIELKITALRTMPIPPDYSCVREGGLVPSTEYTLHLAAPLKLKLGNRLANHIRVHCVHVHRVQLFTA